MLSIEVPAEVTAALDALRRRRVAVLRELDLDAPEPRVRLRVLGAHGDRYAGGRSRTSHDVIGGLAQEDPADLGGPVHKVIADWLRISYTEARRRIRDVAQLSPRLTLTGQELPPELPATAQAWRDGMLDGQHLRVIQTFVRDLPDDDTGRHRRACRTISGRAGAAIAARPAGKGGPPRCRC